MTQPVTPELREWLARAQLAAGHSVPALRASMRAAGWHDAASDAALAQLEAGFPDVEAGPAARRTEMPGPDLDGAPLYLDAGDRRVQVLQTMRHPRVVVFGDLLSGEECEALIAAARQARLARSLTVETKTGGEEVNVDRTSDGMFFERGENEIVARIEQRIATLLRWPLEFGEGLQILRYAPGAQYRPHYDYFDPGRARHAHHPARGGQRVGTLVMYLQEPERGGATTFPDVHLEVAPKRGTASSSATTGPTRPPARCMAARRCWPARNGSRPSGCASASSSKTPSALHIKDRMKVQANGIADRGRGHRGARAAPSSCSSWAWACSSSPGPTTSCGSWFDAGFRVVRHDNRDIGLSQGFDHAGTRNLVWQTMRHRSGCRCSRPTRCRTWRTIRSACSTRWASAKAHIVGASMGGMIAQRLAATAPERTASLVSIMSSSGARGLPGPRREVAAMLMRRPLGRSARDVAGGAQHPAWCGSSRARPIRRPTKPRWPSASPSPCAAPTGRPA
jgi:prolyl 4-hydroxylase